MMARQMIMGVARDRAAGGLSAAAERRERFTLAEEGRGGPQAGSRRRRRGDMPGGAKTVGAGFCSRDTRHTKHHDDQSGDRDPLKQTRPESTFQRICHQIR